MTEPGPDGVLDALREQIAAEGWSVLVHGGDVPVAYTVGLFETFEHPEIVVVGLPPETAHDLLEECGEDVRSGTAFANGASNRDLLTDHEVRFHSVTDRSVVDEVLLHAREHYGDRAFPVLQLVWPDERGRFPGDADVSEEFASAQPRLP
ncbi:MAG: DUF4262 domain-containing protein [Planctomycetes bacterium]|nr:DUF4262 domain-containing protein [Planctomycetota bacterium]